MSSWVVPEEPRVVSLLGTVHAYCPVCECAGREDPCWQCGYNGKRVQKFELVKTQAHLRQIGVMPQIASGRIA